MLHENLISASQKTYSFFTKKTSCLMLFRDIIDVFLSENLKTFINKYTVLADGSVCIVKGRGIHNYQSFLKGYAG
jgi:hypothetical protein